MARRVKVKNEISEDGYFICNQCNQPLNSVGRMVKRRVLCLRCYKRQQGSVGQMLAAQQRVCQPFPLPHRAQKSVETRRVVK